ncbi:MAG: ABC transporter permease subunit [Anaerolineae bacterium]
MNNTGVIFKRTLRDQRKTIIGWGIALAVYMLYVVVLYPTMQQLDYLNEIMQVPIFQALVGSEVTDFTSPGGFIGMYVFLYLPLILAVFAILFGMSITSSEEEQGTLDVLLAAPVPRSQLILEKLAAGTVALALILLGAFVGYLLGVVFTPSLQIDWGVLLLAFLNIIPVTLLMIALTLLLSTILRSRGLVGGIMTVFLVASYFIMTLGQMASEPISNMRYLSIFNYYGGASVITRGMDWGGFAFISVIVIATIALSLFTVQRRDLNT